MRKAPPHAPVSRGLRLGVRMLGPEGSNCGFEGRGCSPGWPAQGVTARGVASGHTQKALKPNSVSRVVTTQWVSVPRSYLIFPHQPTAFACPSNKGPWRDSGEELRLQPTRRGWEGPGATRTVFGQTFQLGVSPTVAPAGIPASWMLWGSQ